jgi:2,4-dienoyl-CoA reductase (NADPH2)
MPNAAFADVTKRLREDLRAAGLTIPVITSNRINTPDTAEQVLADGCTGMVSLARPFCRRRLRCQGRRRPRRRDQHLHRLQPGLPRPHLQGPVGELPRQPARRARDNAVDPRRTGEEALCRIVGAGPAGLAAATTLAERGHEVDLYDSASEIGGQFNLGPPHPRQGEVQRDAALLWQAHRSHRCKGVPRLACEWVLAVIHCCRATAHTRHHRSTSPRGNANGA